MKYWHRPAFRWNERNEEYKEILFRISYHFRLLALCDGDVTAPLLAQLADQAHVAGALRGHQGIGVV